MKDYKNITLKFEVKDDETQDVVKQYIDSDFDNAHIFNYAEESYNWSKKKTVGKLVALGVYKKSTEPEPKEDKPKKLSKKEIIAELESFMGIDLAGLLPAKREELFAIYTFTKSLRDEINTLKNSK